MMQLKQKFIKKKIQINRLIIKIIRAQLILKRMLFKMLKYLDHKV